MDQYHLVSVSEM